MRCGLIKTIYGAVRRVLHDTERCARALLVCQNAGFQIKFYDLETA